MLCQHCKKNTANFNYIEIINGKKYESHLCAKCYAEMYGELHSKPKDDIWAGLFGSPSDEEKVCPVCGTTYSDYEQTGLLGCASCYDVFKEELIPSIQRIQGKVTHVGKAGSNNDEFGLHRLLNTLQEQLEIAIKEKRFYDAGKLNRQIEDITKSIYGGGDGKL